LRLANPDALLCTVVDAADNAQMAAEEIGEARSFVKDLIRASVPDGVRLVFLCRSHRQHYLDPPPEAIALELRPFSRDETEALLRQKFADANERDVDEFHRLSSVSERSARTTGANARMNLSAKAGSARRSLLAKPGRLRTAKPCGPGTRCWCQAGGGASTQPGPNKPSIRRRRRQNEFVSGESSA
jgi:hypothetical protein